VTGNSASRRIPLQRSPDEASFSTMPPHSAADFFTRRPNLPAYFCMTFAFPRPFQLHALLPRFFPTVPAIVDPPFSVSESVRLLYGPSRRALCSPSSFPKSG